ncbi:hypothetical protein SBRY_40787 [Actinacidiphila bryophytorum]|uniref:Uncharacterized protein n=1 Tax=Actinacidiphila bryophytorum TaxID=1436133 RepID=A0A9W4H3N5_9ACTN|nr:hypothetical protein SBRY_40787 [Actinacidiphila bryophytorum]
MRPDDPSAALRGVGAGRRGHRDPVLHRTPHPAGLTAGPARAGPRPPDSPRFRHAFPVSHNRRSDDPCGHPRPRPRAAPPAA